MRDPPPSQIATNFINMIAQYGTYILVPQFPYSELVPRIRLSVFKQILCCRYTTDNFHQGWQPCPQSQRWLPTKKVRQGELITSWIIYLSIAYFHQRKFYTLIEAPTRSLHEPTGIRRCVLNVSIILFRFFAGRIGSVCSREWQMTKGKMTSLNTNDKFSVISVKQDARTC